MRRQGLCSTRWGRMESTMAGMERRPMGRRRPHRQIIGYRERIGFGRNQPVPKRWRSTTRQPVRRFGNDGSKRKRAGGRKGIRGGAEIRIRNYDYDQENGRRCGGLSQKRRLQSRESARGLAQSKTLARGSEAPHSGEAFGVRQSSAALKMAAYLP